MNYRVRFTFACGSWDENLVGTGRLDDAGLDSPIDGPDKVA